MTHAKGICFMASILSRIDIQRCLNMTEAIEAVRTAFDALNAGQAHAPQRMAVGLSEQGIALLMPSLLQTIERHAFGLKVVAVMPRRGRFPAASASLGRHRSQSHPLAYRL
jgi:ornithine cyclodeaminase/alanine dehydrogenase-like protein (mu-crystallin family)